MKKIRQSCLVPGGKFQAILLGVFLAFTAQAIADIAEKNDEQSDGVLNKLLGWFGSDSQNSQVSSAQRSADPMYAEWILPSIAPSPTNNQMDDKKAELGKMLFFDTRLSGNGKMSCATCHNPALGWSDAMPTARGHEGKVLGRATPTILNVGFNEILMWDGRAGSLEEQAMGPITNPNEMNNDVSTLIRTLKSVPYYVKAFRDAFSGMPITESAVRRAIAMYQRQVVINNSRFDKWVQGDQSALTAQEISGFEVFRDPMRGNCIVCHRPPNFTDNGFHNIGLKSYASTDPDMGRFNLTPGNFSRGAFKTPPLRNISETAPYFHDGSATTLEQVVEHYVTGGVVKKDISPNLKPLKLSQQDKSDLVAFLKSLTGDTNPQLVQVNVP